MLCKTSKTTISIVTPSLNHGEFISYAIQSILKQRHPSIEHIIVDGGSRDSTQEVLSGFKTIKIVTDSGKSQSESINLGWQIAQGELLGWLNADDQYEPEALDTISKVFEKHPEVDIIYGDCAYINRHGAHLGAYPVTSFNFSQLVLNAINYIPQPATFIRRRVFESVGFLDESLHYAMDFDYWLRSGSRHKIAYIPVKLAQLRLHRTAKSIKNLENFSEELIGIYAKLFNNANLPDSIKKIEKETMHNVYYRAAHMAFWAKQTSAAFLYAKKALSLCPFRFRTWKLLMMSNMLGEKIANKLMNNPYLKGID